MNVLANKILPSSLLLYATAVLTTMAGMEIFGWLSFILASVVVWRMLSPAFPARPVLRLGDWSLIALMAIIILSALIAAPDSADKMFIIGNSRFVVLFLMIRLGLETVSDEKQERAFKWILILLGFIGLYAIFQHFTGIDYIRGHREPVSKVFFNDGSSAYRARGMWGHPVTFGHAMALSVCMAAGYFICAPKTSKWKWVALTVLLITAGSLLWSYTRGAWIGLAAAGFMMSLYLGRRIAIPIVVASVIGISTGAAISESFRSRLTSIVSLTNQSNTERLDVWRANVAMFQDKPILGVGYGVNEEIIGDYYAKLGIQQQFGGHAHNNYLQFLSGTGLLGFLVFTIFSIAFLWMSHQLLRRLPKEQYWLRAIALGSLGAQVALHVGGLTECNFKDAEVNHQYMLILALLAVAARRSEQLGQTT